ncbi:MAG: HD domain-containing protein [Candidatus Hydrothermae bacterium]|nr:HD domain-containing protein [Candidatus Hydrothermae bacterium]
MMRPLMDAPEVQRLRWVSQLPLEQLVYPSAQHSRFEHSIGVMYLSMVVASVLLEDRQSQDKILADTPQFWREGDADYTWEDLFVLAAGVVGLLHDVGHAPFSHTFEEALQRMGDRYYFHHEFFGYLIAKRLIREFIERRLQSLDIDSKRFFEEITLGALNKEIPPQDLPTLARILRAIVDGPIDTDKGDYLLRDSYHCGVHYGRYDFERLWRFVRLTSDYTLGVHPKGAIEAWTLRFARYKMFQNVYWHHVRDITDELLVEALQSAFRNIKPSHFIYQNLCPVTLPISGEAELTYEERYRLKFWTDTSILRSLEEYAREHSDRNVQEILDWIHHRNLPKRLFKEPSYIRLSLEKSTLDPHRAGIVNRIARYIEENGYLGRSPRIWVVMRTIHPFPLLDPGTVSIRVVDDDGREQPLTQFLGFEEQLKRLDPGLENTFQEESVSNYETAIRVFVRERVREQIRIDADGIRRKILSVVTANEDTPE